MKRLDWTRAQSFAHDLRLAGVDHDSAYKKARGLMQRIQSAQMTREVYECLGWPADGLKSMEEKQRALRLVIIPELLSIVENKGRKITNELAQRASRAGMRDILRVFGLCMGFSDTSTSASLEEGATTILLEIWNWNGTDIDILLESLGVKDVAMLAERFPALFSALVRGCKLPRLIDDGVIALLPQDSDIVWRFMRNERS